MSRMFAGLGMMWTRSVAGMAGSKGFGKRMFASTSSTTNNAWNWYVNVLEAGGWRSLALKAVTSASLCGAGDLLCQAVVEERFFTLPAKWSSLTPKEPSEGDGDEVVKADRQKKMDFARFGRLTFLGGVLVAPTLHFWYGFLCRRFPGSGMRVAVKRMLSDQVLFAPFFIAIGFSTLALIEGRKLKDLEKQLRDDWAGVVVTNWGFWMPIQLVNFCFIPPHLQVLFSNSVSLLWNVYMSHILNKHHNVDPETPHMLPLAQG